MWPEMTVLVFTREFPCGVCGVVTEQHVTNSGDTISQVLTHKHGVLVGLEVGRCHRVVWKQGLEVLVDELIPGKLVTCATVGLWEVNTGGAVISVERVRVRPQKIDACSYQNNTIQAMAKHRQTHRKPTIRDLLAGCQHTERVDEFKLAETIMSASAVMDFWHARMMWDRANCTFLPVCWIGGGVIYEQLKNLCTFEKCHQTNGTDSEIVMKMTATTLSVSVCPIAFFLRFIMLVRGLLLPVQNVVLALKVRCLSQLFDWMRVFGLGVVTIMLVYDDTQPDLEKLYNQWSADSKAARSMIVPVMARPGAVMAADAMVGVLS